MPNTISKSKRYLCWQRRRLPQRMYNTPRRLLLAASLSFESEVVSALQKMKKADRDMSVDILLEDNCLRSINQYFVFQMQTQNPRQHNSFQIFALRLNIGNSITVADFDHILRNYRPFVELRRHIMACCSDNFHATVIG